MLTKAPHVACSCIAFSTIMTIKQSLRFFLKMHKVYQACIIANLINITKSDEDFKNLFVNVVLIQVFSGCTNLEERKTNGLECFHSRGQLQRPVRHLKRFTVIHLIKHAAVRVVVARSGACWPLSLEQYGDPEK